VQRGDYELAAKEYQSLLDIVRAPLAEQGRHALKTAKDLEPVERALDQHRRLAARFEKQGQPKLAIPEWKSVVSLLDLALTRERQNAVVQPGNKTAGSERTRRMLTWRRQQADAYERLGKACERAGDKQAATRNLSLAYRQRAVLFQEEGKPERAIEELMRCATLLPDNTSIHWALAEALEAQNRFADAADQYRVLVRKSPDEIQTRRKLAEMLVKAGKFGEAATECRELIHRQNKALERLSPGLPTSASQARILRRQLKASYTDLATALRGAGRPEEAKNAERLAHAIATEPH